MFRIILQDQRSWYLREFSYSGAAAANATVMSKNQKCEITRSIQFQDVQMIYASEEYFFEPTTTCRDAIEHGAFFAEIFDKDLLSQHERILRAYSIEKELRLFYFFNQDNMLSVICREMYKDWA
ncbi:MAG: hypothetical protein AAFS07_15435 [Pseudomonadota bacterium]